MEILKELPQNLEAEVNVLSACMNDKNKLLEVANELEVNDFYLDKHKKLYKTIIYLFTKDKEITISAIVEVVNKSKLKELGGISYVTDVLGAYVIGTSVKNDINIIKENARRRRLIKTLNKAQEKAYDKSKSIDSIISSIEECNITESKMKIENDKDLFFNTLQEIEKRFKNGGEIPGMKTGFKSFDEATNGFKKGDLTIIAARPSIGKTLVALNIAEGLVSNGYKVGLFEMEMTPEKIGFRRMACLTGIKSSKIQKGELTDKEWVEIAKVANQRANNNSMFTDCSADNGIINIKAKTKMLKMTYGLDVIIIDHLTLLKMDKNVRRDLAVGDITRTCKIMAKELDISVILLSQLSRASEQRADHRPILSDLRDSGDIEQDADTVMFIHREDYYNRDTEEKNVMEWIIAKQRDGATGIIKMNYDPERQIVFE